MSMEQAKELLNKAERVIILAGAGMSAELGTPVYWTGDAAKYADTRSKYGFTELEHATAPLWFIETFSQMNFYSEAYRNINSLHERNLHGSSYSRLLGWLQRSGKDYFCITSNVDSAFLHAGFDSERILEIHGSYRQSQCLNQPAHPTFSTNSEVLNTPCPECGAPSRPNVLFFYDSWFNPEVLDGQLERFSDSLDAFPSTVLLEIGVGTTVMNMRNTVNKLYLQKNFPLIHVNLEPRPEMLTQDMVGSSVPELWVQESAAEALEKLLQG